MTMHTNKKANVSVLAGQSSVLQVQTLVSKHLKTLGHKPFLSWFFCIFEHTVHYYFFPFHFSACFYYHSLGTSYFAWSCENRKYQNNIFCVLCSVWGKHDVTLLEKPNLIKEIWYDPIKMKHFSSGGIVNHKIHCRLWEMPIFTRPLMCGGVLYSR